MTIRSIGVLLLCSAACAQVGQKATAVKPELQPQRQPPDLTLLLQAEDGRREFRRGEAIKLKLGYTFTTPGRYMQIQPADRLEGGQGFSIRCEPGDSAVDRIKDPGNLSAWSILNAGPSCGFGFGGGIGGGCGDCRSELPITREQAWSFTFELNDRVQFMQAGRYSCTAAAADVTQTASTYDGQVAVEMTSAPLVIDVYNDRAWSGVALADAVRQLQSDICKQPGNHEQKCGLASRVVLFLDTEESLAAAVRLLGTTEKTGWEHYLWLAVLQTRHRKLALDLLSKRALDPDFAVTDTVLDTLSAMALREAAPQAFAANANQAAYHPQALDLMRGYIRTLGDSLREKRGNALDVSKSTYEHYASAMFCEVEPLIPMGEMQATLASIAR